MLFYSRNFPGAAKWVKSFPDRFRLAFLSHFTTFWKQALHIVQPDTLLHRHQEMFSKYWLRKSQGKPKISSETVVLIQEITFDELLV